MTMPATNSLIRVIRIQITDMTGTNSSPCSTSLLVRPANTARTVRCLKPPLLMPMLKSPAPVPQARVRVEIRQLHR